MVLVTSVIWSPVDDDDDAVVGVASPVLIHVYFRMSENHFCEFRGFLVGFLKSVHEVRPSYRVLLHSNHLLEYVLPFLVDSSWRLGLELVDPSYICF